jgi:hypothetical protein
MLDAIEALIRAGIWQKLSFHFVFVVVVVTLVRGARVALSAERRALASKVAASTRGLAQAALWSTGAGSAIGLLTAWTPYNGYGSLLTIIAEASLDVFDLTAVTLGLCGLALAGAGVFDAMRTGRPSVWRLARRAVSVVAVVLLAVALVEIRSTYAATLNGRGDDWVANAVWQSVGTFWYRMTWLFAGCGLMTWLCVLADRCRVGSWELEVGS